MKTLGLKQFRQEGCFSYLVFDPASREAAIIDPRADLMEQYREWIAENGLKVLYAVDTQLHLDHLSGTHLFRDELGAEIAMSARTECARAQRKLGDRDRLELGKGAVVLEAFEAPGHSPDAIILAGRTQKADGPRFAFGGNTLLPGTAGRTDLPGGDAAMLWKSLQRLQKELPPSTLVYPAHDSGGILFTTLEAEARRNPVLVFRSAEDFAAARAEESPSVARFPDEVQRRREFNRAARPAGIADGSGPGVIEVAPALSETPAVGTINVEKYEHKLREHAAGHLFLDVREPDEYKDGHMAGAESLPLSEVSLALGQLAQAKRIYVSCLSGRRSGWVANTLSYLGFPDAVNVSGGIKAWIAAGLDVEK